MNTLLFDLDGTLCNIAHRRHFLDGDSPNWARFNEHIGEDLPNEPVVRLYQTLWRSGEYDIILVSGRNERFRAVTEQWLAWHKIPFGRLLLRADNDNRADYLVKQDILNQLIDEGKQILFYVDDRQQVVDMWRKNGITCLQCDAFLK